MLFGYVGYEAYIAYIGSLCSLNQGPLVGFRASSLERHRQWYSELAWLLLLLYFIIIIIIYKDSYVYIKRC